MRSLSLLFFVLCMFSCSSEAEKQAETTQPSQAVEKPAQLRFFNNVEYGPEWINQQLLQSSAIAHSGNHVSVTDTSCPYSLGFRKALSELSSKKIASVTMGAWIYADPAVPLKGLSLVASLNKGEQNVFWFGAAKGDALKGSGKWIYISETIPFPLESQTDLVFSGYVLNNSKNKVLVDDIEFRFNEN